MVKLRKLFLCTVLSACILAGCGNGKQQKEVKETEPHTKEEVAEVLDAEELAQIRKDALEAFEKISFDNIDVKCTTLDFPEIDKLAVYGFDPVLLKDYGTYAQLLDKCMTDIIPKLIGEFNTKYLYDGDVLRGLEPEDYYKADYDNALSHTENYATTPYDFVYRDPEMKKKLELFTGFNALNYSAGKIGNILGVNLLFGVQQEADFVKSYDVLNDDLSDSYMLLDKEVTIKEAVESAEKFWNSTYPLTVENGIKSRAYKVKVYKFKNSGEYVFNIMRTNTYKDIAVRIPPEGKTVKGSDTNELYGEETGVMSEGFMVESDKIDIYYGEYNNYTEPAEIRAYSNIVSFENAIKSVSQELTNLPGEKFELNYAGISYRKYLDENKKEYTYYIAPAWLFVLRNPINEDTVEIIVDMETGDITARIDEE